MGQTLSNSSGKLPEARIMDNPLKRLLNRVHPHNLLNGSIKTRPSTNHHHAALAPILNLVYDSNIKNRSPDFR